MKPSILIVDDDESIRETLEDLILLEGFGVKSAENGQQALEILQTDGDGVCAIILDLLMPVMGGVEFLEKLEHVPARERLPVAVVSGVAERPELPGVEMYLQKPMSFEAVRQFVYRSCGKWKAGGNGTDS